MKSLLLSLGWAGALACLTLTARAQTPEAFRAELAKKIVRHLNGVQGYKSSRSQRVRPDLGADRIVQDAQIQSAELMKANREALSPLRVDRDIPGKIYDELFREYGFVLGGREEFIRQFHHAASTTPLGGDDLLVTFESGSRRKPPIQYRGTVAYGPGDLAELIAAKTLTPSMLQEIHAAELARFKATLPASIDGLVAYFKQLASEPGFRFTSLEAPNQRWKLEALVDRFQGELKQPALLAQLTRQLFESDLPAEAASVLLGFYLAKIQASDSAGFERLRTSLVQDVFSQSRFFGHSVAFFGQVPVAVSLATDPLSVRLDPRLRPLVVWDFRQSKGVDGLSGSLFSSWLTQIGQDRGIATEVLEHAIETAAKEGNIQKRILYFIALDRWFESQSLTSSELQPFVEMQVALLENRATQKIAMVDGWPTTILHWRVALTAIFSQFAGNDLIRNLQARADVQWIEYASRSKPGFLSSCKAFWESLWNGQVRLGI